MSNEQKHTPTWWWEPEECDVDGDEDGLRRIELTSDNYAILLHTAYWSITPKNMALIAAAPETAARAERMEALLHRVVDCAQDAITDEVWDDVEATLAEIDEEREKS